jgi:sortase (surface protein transpeptidase)
LRRQDAVRRPDLGGECRTWLGAALAVAFVVVLGAVTAAVVTGERTDDRMDQPIATQTTTMGTDAEQTGPARGTPVRLVVPQLEVDAAVRPVGLEGDVLVPPEDVAVVGWWHGSAMPGSPRGAVLLAGHSWNGGDGVFDDLGTLRSGDRLTVVTTTGRIDYVVKENSTYTESELARAAARLFAQDGQGRLVAVTCSDYRDGDYHANTVVVCEPALTARDGR